MMMMVMMMVMMRRRMRMMMMLQAIRQQAYPSTTRFENATETINT